MKKLFVLFALVLTGTMLFAQGKFIVGTAANSRNSLFYGEVLVYGDSLIITDATGADSTYVFDEGDSVRVSIENPLYFIGNSVTFYTAAYFNSVARFLDDISVDGDVDFNATLTVDGVTEFNEKVTFDGDSLVIIDASGADSTIMYDEGDTIKITHENPILISGEEMFTTNSWTMRALYGNNSSEFLVRAASGDGAVGADLNLRGGIPATDFAGGAANLLGGDGIGTGNGGTIAVNAGDGGATGAGGALSITSGDGGSTSGNAGSLSLSGGDAIDGSGGSVAIRAGSSGGSNNGPNASLSGGTGGTAGGNGGGLALSGGSAGVASGGNGGLLSIDAGQGDGVGADGDIGIGINYATNINIGAVGMNYSDTYYAGFYANADQNDVAAGGGAAGITTYFTTINSGGANDTITIASGAVVGQMKKVMLVTDGGGDAVLSGTFVGGTWMTFNDSGEYAILMWNGTAWRAIELASQLSVAEKPVIS